MNSLTLKQEGNWASETTSVGNRQAYLFPDHGKALTLILSIFCLTMTNLKQFSVKTQTFSDIVCRPGTDFNVGVFLQNNTFIKFYQLFSGTHTR